MGELTLVGTYNFESSENVDDYLRGLGVGLVLRKVQSVARPNCTITHREDTNQWKVAFESVFKRKESVFRPQEKFEDDTFDSRKCQSTVEVLENGKLMNWTQVCEEGQDVAIQLSVTETGLLMTLKCGELSCRLMFRRGRIENPGEMQIAAAQPLPQPRREEPVPLAENIDEAFDEW